MIETEAGDTEMMTITTGISFAVGFLGFTLTWLVLRGNDWGSRAFSCYRHVQYSFAAIGSVGWSYCILGIATATMGVSLSIGIVTLLALLAYLKIGSTYISKRLCEELDRIKSKLYG